LPLEKPAHYFFQLVDKYQRGILITNFLEKEKKMNDDDFFIVDQLSMRAFS
jgi:hypothetical protein